MFDPEQIEADDYGRLWLDILSGDEQLAFVHVCKPRRECERRRLDDTTSPCDGTRLRRCCSTS